MTETYPHPTQGPPEVMEGQNVLLDQFILFGDSITQQASSQESGFAFQPALQNGKLLRVKVSWLSSLSSPYGDDS